MEDMRLNKFLSDAGVCSRRQADKLIEAGRVSVDGLKAELGQRVTDGAKVCVDGKPVKKSARPVLIAVNKPVGVVTTTAKDEVANIVTYVGYPERIYPIGRLDKDSEGLLLLTRDGEIVNRILRAAGRAGGEDRARARTPRERVSRDRGPRRDEGIHRGHGRRRPPE